MNSSIELFRRHGVRDLAIGGIRLYQQTLSKALPDSCRLLPSCSQYGIEAIARFGLEDGAKLTWQRIRSCRRPNSGYDPVPMYLAFARPKIGKSSVRRQDIDKAGFDTVAKRTTDFRPVYDHKFRLILTYPLDREFYDKADLKAKIAEFNSYVLQIEQYALMFAVDVVEAGKAKGFYLLRLQGTFDGEYLQVKVDEVVKLLILQFENFFTIMQKGDLDPVYFEIDGQVVYQPESEVIPKDHTWDRTSDRDFWDDYWDSYVISELVEAAVNIAVEVLNALPDSPDFADAARPQILDIDPTPPGDLVEHAGNLDLNPFDGDGCSLPENDGCDMPDLDGCDGCGDVPADGCDLGGCSFD